MVINGDPPSGKHTKKYGKSSLFIDKSTISMVMFDGYVKLPKGVVEIDVWNDGLNQGLQVEALQL